MRLKARMVSHTLTSMANQLAMFAVSGVESLVTLPPGAQQQHPKEGKRGRLVNGSLLGRLLARQKMCEGAVDKSVVE